MNHLQKLIKKGIMTDSCLTVSIKKVEYSKEMNKSTYSNRVYLKLNLESTINQTNTISVN
jgi:hypothetical protein